MPRIDYINDETGSFQEAQGSDNRLNVSSRSDNRAYYNSRDDEQCYAMVWHHTAAITGEESFYIKNTSSTLTLVISSIGVNCDIADVRVTLAFVSAAPTGGTAVVPTNLNRHSSNAASGTFLETLAGTTIAVALDGNIDFVHLGVDTHEELRLTDRVRLGQNDAITLEVTAQASGNADVAGVVFFYYE